MKLKKAKADRFCGLTSFVFVFIYTKNTAILLQRDETRRMCSSDTRATVLDRFVGDGELAQVVTAHLRL